MGCASTGSTRRLGEGRSRNSGTAPNYPLIGDSDFKVSKLYDGAPDNIDDSGDAPADNQTVRNVFSDAPGQEYKLMPHLSTMTTGSNFNKVSVVPSSRS